MTLRPWLEIAKPHEDVVSGTMNESLFAADLGLVAAGEGPDDYRDPKTFAAKTYLTKSLEDVLVGIAKRLAGDDGAPAVLRLQTEFGGGKTHTLLAAYHAFGDPEKIAGTPLGTELAKRLSGGGIPKAKVVVLDGAALTPTPVELEPDVVAHTFLGHLAWRLGGKVLYEMVREQDEGLLGTSTVKIVDLLRAAAPCLVLLDETLEYLSKVLEVRSHEGSLAATTLTTIKELCSAAPNVSKAVVLATLTASNVEDYSSVAGQDLFNRLSKVVGRTENIITPVEGDDVFPILRIRLFSDVGTEAERREVAEAYGGWYGELGDVLPGSVRDASYRDRMAAAYPFHPELIDILTNRWGSLSGFQRTRGALRMLANTVRVLANRTTPETLILPGDVPLDDSAVRAEILKFAGDSYKSVLNSDIIRSDSKSVEEDRRRGGEVEHHHIGVGLATTIFLESFGPDKVLGASSAQMLLGVGRPGASRGVLDDVRDALAQTLWYMRYEGGRYRFTTEANLNKVIIEREGAIDSGRIAELLREATSKVSPQTPPFRVEVGVSMSTDLVDERRLVLGVLDASLSLGAEATGETERVIDDVLNNRGSTARVNKNAVVLVVADAQVLGKARQTARTLAAMRDITNDKHRVQRFNKEQREQLAERVAQYEERLPNQLVMAYHHLAMLGSDGNGGIAVQRVDLGAARVSDTIPARVRDHLKGNDRLLDGDLSPATLLSARFNLLPDDEPALEIETLLSYFYRLPRLPRLASQDVLRNCLVAGTNGKVFGLASGAAWNAVDAVLSFGSAVDPAEVMFQPGTWLVRASAMEALLAARTPASSTDGTVHGRETPVLVPGGPGGDERTPTGTTPPAGADTVTHVVLSITGAPADKVRDIVKVAVLPLAASGAEVSTKIEINALNSEGFSRTQLDLVVKEGLSQLGVEFEIKES